MATQEEIFEQLYWKGRMDTRELTLEVEGEYTEKARKRVWARLNQMSHIGHVRRVESDAIPPTGVPKIWELTPSGRKLAKVIVEHDWICPEHGFVEPVKKPTCPDCGRIARRE